MNMIIGLIIGISIIYIIIVQNKNGLMDKGVYIMGEKKT